MRADDVGMPGKFGEDMANRCADSLAKTAARIASVLGPRMMRLIARFNRHVTNRTQQLWATRLRHAAVIEHRGRNSGKTYQTPAMAFVEDGSLAVVLNYGEQSDWVRNVVAAGTAVVLHRGKRYTLSAPRIVSLDSPELPAGVRAIGVSERRALTPHCCPLEKGNAFGIPGRQQARRLDSLQTRQVRHPQGSPTDLGFGETRSPIAETEKAHPRISSARPRPSGR
jgi:deazaflavin-dependent oxidoreductase (nitroreductase family)